MRRVIAAVLLAAMLVSATNLSVFAETSSKAATQAVGNLTVGHPFRLSRTFEQCGAKKF